MGKNEEIELKLRVMDETCWTALCEAIEQEDRDAKREEIEMAANYYDTEDSLLRMARLSYRVRAENGNWVATLKGGGSSEGGLHRRSEWYVTVQSDAPDLRVFAGTAAEPLVAGFFEKTLQPIVQTKFCRQAVTLKKGNTMIEAALDRGIVCGGSRKASIAEVELELKCGTPVDLLGMGADLAERFPLILERRSKFFRGLILAGMANDDKVGSQAEDAVMSAIYGLLDLIYEAWDCHRSIGSVAYAAQLTQLRNAVSETDLSRLLMPSTKASEWGGWYDGQMAVGALLRCWQSKIRQQAQ